MIATVDVRPAILASSRLPARSLVISSVRRASSSLDHVVCIVATYITSRAQEAMKARCEVEMIVCLEKQKKQQSNALVKL